MIDKRELSDFARELGIEPRIIDKDYVLGWILAGIANHPVLSKTWVFKGGTCLKKCFFETYRFSEDLDFTVQDPKLLGEKFLLNAFNDVAAWVYDKSGVELPRDTFKFETHKEEGDKISVEGKIGYVGPYELGGSKPRIKLDLTSDEIMVLPALMKDVYHPYSDCPEGGISVSCYSYEELFAEKMRALAQRARPRDLYDVIHLYRHKDVGLNKEILIGALQKKCAYKNIDVPSMSAIEGHAKRDELVSEWQNMLEHQIAVLPPLEHFWNELPQVFDWLFGPAIERKLASVPVRKEDHVDASWTPPSRAILWHADIPIEKIRFAQANRLCLEILYHDGGKRIIEPYALLRSREGKLLLGSVKHETGEYRTYRIDRIRDIKVTQTPFTPRFEIQPL